MTTLTLSIDEQSARTAQRIAQQRQTTVDAIVQELLDQRAVVRGWPGDYCHSWQFFRAKSCLRNHNLSPDPMRSGPVKGPFRP